MERIPVFYTFGNHMHWVDMEWLWGYHVLPGSIRDMLHFCRETGAKGCVNFDGVGYEKLAAEDPDALAELRQAIQEGTIEPVGCSYGQPYGLFHGGESNIRQRIYGVRTVMRLLGVRPKTFWEEEFDFFPQLPQMLKSCGFEYASLFFQWTWHTPEIPKEEVPVIWWEGIDGSRLLTATRNKLNLHQWPEDFDGLLDELAMECGASAPPSDSDFSRVAQNPAPLERQIEGGAEAPHSTPTPLILQWLELMPSPDWMCRSEVLLPRMKELLSDPRFEVKFATLGEYLEGVGRGMGVPPMVSPGVSPGEEEPQIRRRQGAYLPHWTREGGIYAVTFRLEDALPKQVQLEYSEEKQKLKRQFERGLLSAARYYEYLRLHTARIEEKLDAGIGECLLRKPHLAQLVFDAMKHFNGVRYRLLAAAVMPNHVHVVVEPINETKLEGILHSWKSFTAHEINRLENRSGPLWQVEYYDHLIRDEKDLENQIAYVVTNPGRASLDNWPCVFHDRDGHGDHGRDAHATAHAAHSSAVPVRRYSLDEVWHGMSLGKNGDAHPKDSRYGERSLLDAEALFAVASLFGRPYSSWDVYPVWELEEGWRTLLAFQHHDNHECEGLCGDIAARLRQSVPDGLWFADRLLELLARRAGLGERETFVFNGRGWPGPATVVLQESQSALEMPAFGYRCQTLQHELPTWTEDDRSFKVDSNGLKIVMDRTSGMVTRLGGFECTWPMIEWVSLAREKVEITSGTVAFDSRGRWDEYAEPRASVGDETDGAWQVTWEPRPLLHVPGLELEVTRSECSLGGKRSLAPGFEGAVRIRWPLDLEPDQYRFDHPNGVSVLSGTSSGVRKYPKGDWMTSEQWFEQVEGAFTAYSFVDCLKPDGSGILIAHSGSQQWFLRDGLLENILDLSDPWDQGVEASEAATRYWIIPHGPWTDADRVRASSGLVGAGSYWFRAQTLSHFSRLEPPIEPLLPREFSALRCANSSVIPTAFYREAEDYAGKHLDNYAGRGMGYPFILRLVEFDGEPADVELILAGPIAKAFKANLMGEIEKELTPIDLSQAEIDERPLEATQEELDRFGIVPQRLQFRMRAHEIATLYLDLVPGRKQTRDLDAKREVWATVHRQG